MSDDDHKYKPGWKKVIKSNCRINLKRDALVSSSIMLQNHICLQVVYNVFLIICSIFDMPVCLRYKFLEVLLDMQFNIVCKPPSGVIKGNTEQKFT